MPRTPISLTLDLFAVALIAVPAALAKGSNPLAARIQGVCTQQSRSTLKVSREDRGTEVEFEVDQNRNGVPWTVRLSRNGNAIASFTATTRAPSGSFEIHRVIARGLAADRITAVATRASGETCTAGSSAQNAKAAAAPAANAGHDAGDDHGRDSGGHS